MPQESRANEQGRKDREQGRHTVNRNAPRLGGGCRRNGSHVSLLLLNDGDAVPRALIPLPQDAGTWFRQFPRRNAANDQQRGRG